MDVYAKEQYDVTHSPSSSILEIQNTTIKVYLVSTIYESQPSHSLLILVVPVHLVSDSPLPFEFLLTLRKAIYADII